MSCKSLEEQFNGFIIKWCGDNAPHLLDTDDNDGEYLRQAIRDALSVQDERWETAFKEQCLVNVDGDCKYWNIEDEDDEPTDKFFPERVLGKIKATITSQQVEKEPKS